MAGAKCKAADSLGAFVYNGLEMRWMLHEKGGHGSFTAG